MTKVEKLERDVATLSDEELAEFRNWFAAFDAAAWDREFADDAATGTLDSLADAALAEHRAGRSRTL